MGMDMDMRSNVAMNSNSVSSNINSIINTNGNMNGNMNTNTNVKEIIEKKTEEKKEEEEKSEVDEPTPSLKKKFSYPPKSIQECTWIRNIHVDPTQALHDSPTIDDIKQWTFDPLLYHNWFHITSVLHMTFMFLTEGGGEEYLEDVDIFALLFSAFIHDVDHTGRNNVFENNSNSVLSQKFDKASPLENNSVDVTYTKILTQPSCNILSAFEREEAEEGSTSISVLKELIKEIVLVTDVPTYHGGLVKKVKVLQEKVTATFGTSTSEETDVGTPVVSSSSSSSVCDIQNTEHRLMLCQVIIK